MNNQADTFINRELSWIEFNKRVLLTGMQKEYKILDQVKFCSIFSNNLDEFYMVRVASLKAQVEAVITKKSIDGLSPKEQLTKINKEVKKLTDLQENYVNDLIKDENNSKNQFVRIKIPTKNINRFIEIPREIVEKDDSSQHFICVEDLIGNNINALFNGMECINYSFFRVTRDAD